ncbi:short-chain fatty acyl-CoA regulator family protein [Nocardia sp. NBC_00565]|uniref:short-chain fatty acyl-CoA regulator family protein n=1 Tax=Nocardia sp. NBC_00565 TaxID=2975993 RepID=UPI002E8060F5|nr:short-chain fatty acyl-CoA regulator family protein [Nocardia sp. NBC_00565]WUC00878.1 short-chain fatty acyl-CoA regulator family protein [Nocardia sp. NBC_00565]
MSGFRIRRRPNAGAFFAADTDARLLADLQEVFAEDPEGASISTTEIDELVSRIPAAARVLVGMHRRLRGATDQLERVSADIDSPAHDSATAMPYEDVRAFQLATQLAFLTRAETVNAVIAQADSLAAQSRGLLRVGLANYFAGALILPYTAFHGAAEALRYDIDLLSTKFEVGFETVCHRLSTLQRPGKRGVPFLFVRTDRAGNISKRQSATAFHFSRVGGSCPLWVVHEAFATPGRIRTQIAQMPDGRRYLWLARTTDESTPGYLSPKRDFAIGLGCDLTYAHKLVYSHGLPIDDPSTAVPIGPGCKVCERTNCAQRAFPQLGRPIRVDENSALNIPYTPTDQRS